mmetsp:Transcript_4888/g.18338  ORF Transcript_4888/g.18338 Transcript_4888/m.18338 type:complete len:242 (+) Transcript_4888:2579-3304(+)
MMSKVPLSAIFAHHSWSHGPQERRNLPIANFVLRGSTPTSVLKQASVHVPHAPVERMQIKPMLHLRMFAFDVHQDTSLQMRGTSTYHRAKYVLQQHLQRVDIPLALLALLELIQQVDHQYASVVLLERCCKYHSTRSQMIWMQTVDYVMLEHGHRYSKVVSRSAFLARQVHTPPLLVLSMTLFAKDVILERTPSWRDEIHHHGASLVLEEHGAMHKERIHLEHAFHVHRDIIPMSRLLSLQ